MCHWRLGQKEKAREAYDQAVDKIEAWETRAEASFRDRGIQKYPPTLLLRKSLLEAAELLGLQRPGASSETAKTATQPHE
jgi:hypothetical protein